MSFCNLGSTQVVRHASGNVTTIPDFNGTLPTAADVCTLEMFGAVGDGSTDDSTAIDAAETALTAGTYKTLRLGARTYLGTWDFTIPANCSVIGQGPGGTILKTTTDGPVFNVGGEDTLIADLTILGNSTGSSQRGIVDGDPASAGSGHSRCQIRNVVLKDLGADGYRYAQNPLSSGAPTFQGPILSNVLADGCATGFRFDTRGEYARLSNCSAQRCTWGAYIDAGNVGWCGGSITKNTNGIDLVHGTNSAHGEIVGVAINHNLTISIRYRTILGQRLVGCSLFQGATGSLTVTADAKGLMFANCQLDPADIVLETGAECEFSDCLFNGDYLAAVTVHDNAKLIVTNPRLVADLSLPSLLRTYIQRAFTFASDANDALTIQESAIPTLIVAAGTISVPRQITSARAPQVGMQQRIVNNNAQNITFKWSSGATVTINAGTWALVGSDGTDAIKLES